MNDRYFIGLLIEFTLLFMTVTVLLVRNDRLERCLAAGHRTCPWFTISRR